MQLNSLPESISDFPRGKGAEKKQKKNNNCGFMYVCVAEKCEVMVFSSFFSTVVSIDNFPPLLRKKSKMMVFKDVQGGFLTVPT